MNPISDCVVVFIVLVIIIIIIIIIIIVVIENKYMKQIFDLLAPASQRSWIRIPLKLAFLEAFFSRLLKLRK